MRKEDYIMLYREWNCCGVNFLVAIPETKEKPKKKNIFDKIINLFFTIEEK